MCTSCKGIPHVLRRFQPLVLVKLDYVVNCEFATSVRLIPAALLREALGGNAVEGFKSEGATLPLTLDS